MNDEKVTDLELLTQHVLNGKVRDSMRREAIKKDIEKGLRCKFCWSPLVNGQCYAICCTKGETQKALDRG